MDMDDPDEPWYARVKRAPQVQSAGILFSEREREREKEQKDHREGFSLSVPSSRLGSPRIGSRVGSPMPPRVTTPGIAGTATRKLDHWTALHPSCTTTPTGFSSSHLTQQSTSSHGGCEMSVPGTPSPPHPRPLPTPPPGDSTLHAGDPMPTKPLKRKGKNATTPERSIDSAQDHPHPASASFVHPRLRPHQSDSLPSAHSHGEQDSSLNTMRSPQPVTDYHRETIKSANDAIAPPPAVDSEQHQQLQPLPLPPAPPPLPEVWEETVQPPENFTMVSSWIYRSSFPSRRHFGFLRGLGLRNILTLVLETYPTGHKQWLKEEGIGLLQFGLPGNKEPFVHIPPQQIAAALAALLDRRNHPILVHCNKGKHRTGCLVGCLRKMQQWSLTAIFEEYRRFASPKPRAMDQEFIELFDTRLVWAALGENARWLPHWAVLPLPPPQLCRSISTLEYSGSDDRLEGVSEDDEEYEEEEEEPGMRLVRGM